MNKLLLPLAILLVCGLYGCVAHSPSIQIPRAHPSALYNATQTITDLGQEKLNASLYTYVLFNRQTSGRACLHDECYASLCCLLESLRFNEPDIDELEDIDAYLASINIFVIPVNAGGDIVYENYSSALSMRILRKLTLLTPSGGNAALYALLDQPGPFLVTTDAPLECPGSNPAIFIADLSRLHHNAMTRVMGEYKKALHKGIPYDVTNMDVFVYHFASFFSRMADAFYIIINMDNTTEDKEKTDAS